MSKPLVTNADSKTQVKNAEKEEKKRKHFFREDLRKLMNSIEGRSVLMAILEQCGAFRGVYGEGNSIYYNSGRQDVGHWLLEQMSESNPIALAKELVDRYNKNREE